MEPSIVRLRAQANKSYSEANVMIGALGAFGAIALFRPVGIDAIIIAAILALWGGAGGAATGWANDSVRDILVDSTGVLVDGTSLRWDQIVFAKVVGVNVVLVAEVRGELRRFVCSGWYGWGADRARCVSAIQAGLTRTLGYPVTPTSAQYEPATVRARLRRSATPFLVLAILEALYQLVAGHHPIEALAIVAATGASFCGRMWSNSLYPLRRRADGSYGLAVPVQGVEHYRGTDSKARVSRPLGVHVLDDGSATTSTDSDAHAAVPAPDRRENDPKSGGV
ncbi:MAG: hypothetical protein ACHREM_18960 [Polyangiales bacterium]